MTQPPRETPDLLTVKEYAELRRVSEETVRRWLRGGKIEATRTCQPLGHWRIPRPDNDVAA